MEIVNPLCYSPSEKTEYSCPHIHVNIYNQPVLFHHRYELTRRNYGIILILPSDKRFTANNPSVKHIYLRLDIDKQLFILKCIDNIILNLMYIIPFTDTIVIQKSRKPIKVFCPFNNPMYTFNYCFLSTLCVIRSS